MTIGLIDDLIEMTQNRITELDGRVYRTYPSVDADTDVPFAVINQAGRQVIQTDSDGSELVVALTYSIDFFAESMTELDSIFYKLNGLYNSKGLTNQGYNPSYNTQTETCVANATWYGVVDVRGGVHRG